MSGGGYMKNIKQEVWVARPIVLSNGELHVGLNIYGVVHDFYYPYVGFENHAAGPSLRHKLGVYVNDTLSWTDDGTWTLEFHYPHNALIGHIMARNAALGILLEIEDAVDAEMNVYIRNIHVINETDQERSIKVFTYQAFVIGDSRSTTDTAQYLPDSDAILHYRGRRAFVVSGYAEDVPFDQFSIGLFGSDEHQGTFRDAEDGELSGNVVEHGRVDSALRFALTIPAHASKRVHYWIAAGTNTREALFVHKQVQEAGVFERIHATAEWWHTWLKPAIETSKKLPEVHQKHFVESVMIIKSQMDKRGAIIASTDSTLLNYSKDNYAYCWPRDGANVIWPLIRLGYYEEPYRFFEFVQRAMHPGGYVMHKYRADGALGSSWHPYVHGSTVSPPIQEDETALVVFVFVQFYQLSKDSRLIKDFYHSLIRPMADFMTEFIDETTGLPKPSYDLWEERFLINTHSTAVTYGALMAAAELATVAGDNESAVKWQSAAESIQAAAHTYLFNEERQVLYRGIIVENGTITYDAMIDTAAIYGAFLFGLFSSDSAQLQASMATTQQIFAANPDTPGLPRYEDDPYRRQSSGIQGNWWYITTLWHAQYSIETGNTPYADSILQWVVDHMLSTGMMGEQIDPVTNEVVSPAPLTWTHAEYVSTLIDYLGRER